MFLQEINFYRYFKLPEAPESLLSWNRFVSLIFTSILVFMSYSCFLYLDVYETDKSTEIIKMQSESLDRNFEVIKRTYPGFFFSDNVEQKIEEMRKDLLAKESVIKTIVNKSLFSENLEALSRLAVENVWLTEIKIEDGTDQIVLKGKSINETSMQNFISKITADTFFANYVLFVKSIENKKNNSESMDFEILLKRP
jgi:hypothetical protein